MPNDPHAFDVSRRRWLLAAGACAVMPVRVAFAATPQARGKLIVVMLRGALDGLAAVPATGDPNWQALRGSAGDAMPPRPLDTTFGLHAALTGLHGWYTEGQLLVVHAVASPYRDRSHFDAQQMLESGGQRPFELATGWLGRALQASGRRGVAISPSMPVALRGSTTASTWTPSRGAAPDADLMARVAHTYANDPVLSARLEQALQQRAGAGAPGMGGMGAGAGNPGAFTAFARQAGRFLSETGGPDIAWLDVDGWDTHTGQVGRLQRQLTALDSGLLALSEALGPLWADTTVLVMTEFGRSAALNGTGGTDHGTGGVAFVAGGAVAGGRVMADWPGLGRNELHEGRDLRPTRDIRTLIQPLLQRHLGLDSARLAADVLPGAPRDLPELWRT